MRLLVASAMITAIGVVLPHADAAPSQTAQPAAIATAYVATPTLSFPPQGLHGHPLWDSWYDLAPFGYQQQEYFVSGTASNGKGSFAPYTTRIIVFRPQSASRFNGTVVLDWANVTERFENAGDTMETRETLMRQGFAYVHVSAQADGVCCAPLTPKVWDPVRYAALSHPGDAYSYNIFAQVGKLMRTAQVGALRPMGDLITKHVLAMGWSQSASLLHNYLMSWQPSTGLIDGFLLRGDKRTNFPAPLSAKVIHLLSDGEADPKGASNDPNYRLWEIAGTAHFDYFVGYQTSVGLMPRTLANTKPKSLAQYTKTMLEAGNYGQEIAPLQGACIVAGSTMPMHYAASSALYQLDRWVTTGVVPKRQPRFTFRGNALATDGYGNTLGGVRMPPIDVPVATYRTRACRFSGITQPFPDTMLHKLYPTHAIYLAKMRAATDRAVRAGWLLRDDAWNMMGRACSAKFRWGGKRGAPCPPYTPPAYDA
jgi:hypothetical protein